MPKIRDDSKKNQLTQAQECYFEIGHTWEFMDHREYPFRDEIERKLLWSKFKNHLIAKCHEPRITKGFCDPARNQLRPEEYWMKDVPEPKRILNRAKEIDGNFDKEPLEETDFEYLSRLNLLTKEDMEYSQTEDFKESEKFAIDYRYYSDMNFEPLMQPPATIRRGSTGMEPKT